MLQVRWKRHDFDRAIALADTLLDRFEDNGAGGFFFTAHDAEPLPQRPMPFIDESLPAGNGVAARALLKLGHLVGEARYLAAAERTLRAAWPTLAEIPHACAAMLLALGDFLQPRSHVVVRYEDEQTTQPWRAALAERRDVDAYFIPAAEQNLSGVLGQQAASGEVTAYFCTGTACDPPLTNAADFAAALQRAS
jgi:uncharacterized protein YyaL (SSP411 family)